MKRLFQILTVFCVGIFTANAQSSADFMVFDPGFRKCVLSVDATSSGGNGNGFIELSEAQSYTGTIVIGGMGVYPSEVLNTNGIEKFTNITGFICNGMSALKFIDLSNNNKLINLEITYCTALTGFNVNRTSLQKVYLRSNTAISTPINISGAQKLTYFLCMENTMADLDISNATNLTEASIYSNSGLKTMTLSGMNALTTFNFSNNPNTTSVSCVSTPQLKYLICNSNTSLQQVSLSGAPELLQLECNGNALTTLATGANPKLKILNCYSNKLTSLSIVKSTLLEQLGCASNLLTSINVNANTALTKFICGANNLTGTLKLITNLSLKEFNAQSNPLLTTICIPYTGFNSEVGKTFSKDATASWSSLCCQAVFPDAKFKAVLLAHVPKIDVNDDKIITCYEASSYTGKITIPTSSGVKSLAGIEYFTNITGLAAQSLGLTSVDLTSNTKLTSLNLFENNLTSINLSQQPNLTSLNLYGNNLTSINLSQQPNLTALYIHSNKLTSLNLSNNTKLKILWFETNSISSVDLSKNTVLEILHIDRNPFTTIDLSKNTALLEIHLRSSKLSTLNLCSNTKLKKVETELSFNLLTISYSNTGIVINKDNHTSTIKCGARYADIDLTQESEIQAISISPNPSQGIFTINNLGSGVIQLFDVTGNKVFEAASMGGENIDVSHLSKGMYIIKITDETNTSSQKIVIE